MEAITIATSRKLTAIESEPLLKKVLPKVHVADKIILDLRDTEYLSSSALRVFLIINKALKVQGKEKLILMNVSKVTLEYLTLAGFESIVKIC